MTQLREMASAPDHDFLIEPAEERLLPPSVLRGRGHPMREFVAPQVQRERLECREQWPPQIAQRMPPARQRIIDNDDAASRLHHAEDFAQRSLAIMRGLLVQQEEQQGLV